MRRLVTLLLAVAASACHEAGIAPQRVSRIVISVRPVDTAQVRTNVGEIVVSLLDEGGAPVPGAVTRFAVASGGGAVSAVLDTSSADGSARTGLTLGTGAGPNDVWVSSGSAEPLLVQVVAVPAPAARLQFSITDRWIRLAGTRDNAHVTATARDAYGNLTGSAVTWSVRDSTLLRVNATSSSTVSINVERRPGHTFVLAESGNAVDSIHVVVLDSTSGACDFLATPDTLAVGEMRSLDSGVACVRTGSAHGEYVIVAHFNTVIGDALTDLDIFTSGIVGADSGFPASRATPSPRRPSTTAADSFHAQLRSRERAWAPGYVPAARAWFRERRAAGPAVLGPGASVGDLVTLNTNGFDFCANAAPRVARVAAVTDGSIILADTLNPPGGFTDAEYLALGAAMDTLVIPVDTAAFGAPADIDGNGRVVILFTSAVNALTPPGSQGGVVLGFYYLRDLLPRESALGSCPGSNVGEMFYVIAPDPNGAVNGNARTKEFVERNAVGVLAHELQHLINASRRMYVNDAPSVDEEFWLNEGLSHVAEELTFYRSSGLAPRQNIGAAELAVPEARAAFDRFQAPNFARYRLHLFLTDLTSPFDPIDFLETRGATWSFLRYAADHARTTDGDFWHRLVNSRLTGIANLNQVLDESGLSVLGAVRDWSISQLTDDLPPGFGAPFQQPSWNFISAMSVLPGLSFTLFPDIMIDGGTYETRLIGGGVRFLRFGLARDRPALLLITAFQGGPIPPGARLLLLRLR